KPGIAGAGIVLQHSVSLREVRYICRFADVVEPSRFGRSLQQVLTIRMSRSDGRRAVVRAGSRSRQKMGGRSLVFLLPPLLPYWLFSQQIDRHGSYTEMLQQTLRIALPIRNERPTEHLSNPNDRL